MSFKIKVKKIRFKSFANFLPTTNQPDTLRHSE